MNFDPDLEGTVRRRLDSLTKPHGSLGYLEDIATRFCLIRGEAQPTSSRKAMYIFCGDHGITEEGVSLFPSEVTAQMVANFLRGGAAINVLCRQFDIHPVIVDCGVKGTAVEGVLDRKVAPGTRNFLREPAMTREQAEEALNIGRELAEDAANSYDVCGLGEMGIGNTTPAAAIFSVYSGRPPAETSGAGTGLDSAGISRKADVIARALQIHYPNPRDPIGVLSAVGGFEIAALAGFIHGASNLRLPVVLDGFISCSAAFIARALSPDALDTAFFSHCSQERGHSTMLECLGVKPYLDLRMRLGEGTGAALMMNMIESSMRLYREMATFAEASVSDRQTSVE